jgi:hypothetical protein
MSESDDLHFHLHVPRTRHIPHLHLHLHFDETGKAAFTAQENVPKSDKFIIHCPDFDEVWPVDGATGATCAHGRALIGDLPATEIYAKIESGACGSSPPAMPASPNGHVNYLGDWAVSLTGAAHNPYGTAANCLWVWAVVGTQTAIRRRPFFGQTADNAHCTGIIGEACPDSAIVARSEPEKVTVLSPCFAIELQVSARPSQLARELSAIFGKGPLLLRFQEDENFSRACWSANVKSLGRITLKVQDNAGYFAARVALETNRGAAKRLVWATEKFLPAGESKLDLIEPSGGKYPNLLVKPVV